MSNIVQGRYQNIDFRGRVFEHVSELANADEMDRKDAWQIKLYQQTNPLYAHAELWVKWDGLPSRHLMLLYGNDYLIASREEYVSELSLHSLVHEYADAYELTKEERAHAIDGIELALTLLHKV